MEHHATEKVGNSRWDSTQGQRDSYDAFEQTEVDVGDMNVSDEPAQQSKKGPQPAPMWRLARSW